MTQDIDLTGYTTEEIQHLERVEQQAALFEEINWMGDQLKRDDRDVALSALNRLQWLNQQNAMLEQKAAQWEAVAKGALASEQQMEKQRDAVLDEYSEYIKAVADGSHADVKALIEETHQAAYDEFQANAQRLMEMAQKLRAASPVED
jgi:hypothetical protein